MLFYFPFKLYDLNSELFNLIMTFPTDGFLAGVMSKSKLKKKKFLFCNLCVSCHLYPAWQAF